jgi:hypothetical protein
MELDVIDQEFKDRGILKGQTYRYPADVALDIISRCRELGIKIHWIETFTITDKITQPHSAESIDFWVELNRKGEGNWDLAEDFIKNKQNAGYYFEFDYG